MIRTTFNTATLAHLSREELTWLLHEYKLILPQLKHDFDRATALAAIRDIELVLSSKPPHP